MLVPHLAAFWVLGEAWWGTPGASSEKFGSRTFALFDGYCVAQVAGVLAVNFAMAG